MHKQDGSRVRLLAGSVARSNRRPGCMIWASHGDKHGNTWGASRAHMACRKALSPERAQAGYINRMAD